MKLIPATLETLEALPHGAIVTPIVDHYNDYVFLKSTTSVEDMQWFDVGLAEGHSAAQVLHRCTSNQQTQLIQLWPDDDIDILKELAEHRDQLANLTGKLASLDLSRTAADGFLHQLRREHDGLTNRVFDNHAKQDTTNRGFTNRIEAVSERSSREETRLSERLGQQERLIQELQAQLSKLRLMT